MGSFHEIDYANIEMKKVGIGILGYGFMGKVHSNAFFKMKYTYASPPAFPEFIAMCGRNEEKVKDSAMRFGYKGYYTKWQDLIEDPRIEIFDNCSNDYMHFEPTLAALKAGKHVICEKPLAKTVEEAKQLAEAAKGLDTKHMTCFNYRFIPAVRLAKNIIDEGRIGTIYQFRGRYLQQSGHNPEELFENVPYARKTGSGIMLGIGSHMIDMARFLVGGIASVCGQSKTFTTSRKSVTGEDKAVEVDESNVALIEFEDGAIGTIESSGISTGRKNQNTWEINGSKGSIQFDLEDLNHLHVHLEDEQREDVRGFTEISVTEPYHPNACLILPRGHNAGWEYGHVHALSHFVNCVVNDLPVAPYGATIEDGYKVQVIMEAMIESSKTGRRIDIAF